MTPKNPDEFNENKRKEPKEPKDHNVHPRSKYEGRFDNPETAQGPFERLYDYVLRERDLKREIRKGGKHFLGYIAEHPLMDPQKYLDIIKEKDGQMFLEINSEFSKRENSWADFQDVVSFVNEPGTIEAAEFAVKRFSDFLHQK